MITAIGLKSEMMMRVVGGFFDKLEGGGLSNFFYSVSSGMGTSLTLVMLVGILAAAVFLSIRISMFIYLRKEF